MPGPLLARGAASLLGARGAASLLGSAAGVFVSRATAAAGAVSLLGGTVAGIGARFLNPPINMSLRGTPSPVSPGTP